MKSILFEVGVSKLLYEIHSNGRLLIVSKEVIAQSMLRRLSCPRINQLYGRCKTKTTLRKVQD